MHQGEEGGRGGGAGGGGGGVEGPRGGGGTQPGKGYRLRSDHWRAVAVARRDS